MNKGWAIFTYLVIAVLAFFVYVLILNVYELIDRNEAAEEREAIMHSQINYLYEMTNELVEATDNTYQEVRDDHGKLRVGLANNHEKRGKKG